MDDTLANLICNAFENDATDVFLAEGEPPRIRKEGQVTVLHPGPIPAAAMQDFWRERGADPADKAIHERDTSWLLPGVNKRLRVHLYRTLNRLAAVLRPIRSDIPALEDLGLPAELLTRWMQRRLGLILVTGPTGSGKSTTVASMIDWLNHNHPRHIVTLEDPVEYLFQNDRAVFSQREIRTDAASFSSALHAAMRQSPDVIFIGEIRDRETALTALQAAETGHLVIATLHSGSAVETLERITHLIDPANTGALRLLATHLVGTISQQLLPRIGGGLFVALEYFQNEAASRRWIADCQTAELQEYLQKSPSPETCSLLDYLVAATKQGFIDPADARSVCARPQDFDRAMRGIS
ncbi:MAG: ATPase, T2SS/T4P/T4SS family [Verrucomicrobiota bacterium]